MKKTVIAFANSLGYRASYSGKAKTMFFSRASFASEIDIEAAIIARFGMGLRFKLATD